LKIKHAKILQNIKLFKVGDSYDVECDDGYEVAKQRLHRHDRYIGGRQGKLKTFQVQNSKGHYVFIAENVNENSSVVCSEGKPLIRDHVHLCTC